MVAYAVHTNMSLRTRAAVPFLLYVQSDMLSQLGTRLVVPLYRQDVAGGAPLTQLCPVILFQGVSLVAVVPEAAGIPMRELGPVVGDLAAHRAEILAAMDLLLTGF
jgi:toxin CcdB